MRHFLPYPQPHFSLSSPGTEPREFALVKQLPAIYSEHPPPPFESHKTREPSAPPATVSGVAGNTGLCSASLLRSVHDQHRKGDPGTLCICNLSTLLMLFMG